MIVDDIIILLWNSYVYSKAQCRVKILRRYRTEQCRKYFQQQAMSLLIETFLFTAILFSKLLWSKQTNSVNKNKLCQYYFGVRLIYFRICKIYALFLIHNYAI